MPSPWSFGAEVRVVGSMHGEEIIQVLHFATNETINDNPDPGGTLLLQLLNALLACAQTKLLPFASSDYKLQQIDGKVIAPVLGETKIVVPGNPDAGSRGPSNVSFAAACVSKTTSLGGKSHRGRNYWPPPGDDDMTNSEFDPDVLLILADFLLCVASKFVGPNPTEVWRLGVLSSKTFANSANNFNNAFTQVTGLVPRKFVARMSSRQHKNK